MLFRNAQEGYSYKEKQEVAVNFSLGERVTKLRRETYSFWCWAMFHCGRELCMHWLDAYSNTFFFFFLSLFIYLFIYLFWERERVQAGGRAEREGDRGSKESFMLTALSLMWASNSQTLRSLPELKSDAQLTEPPRCPQNTSVFFLTFNFRIILDLWKNFKNSRSHIWFSLLWSSYWDGMFDTIHNPILIHYY